MNTGDGRPDDLLSKARSSAWLAVPVFFGLGVIAAVLRTAVSDIGSIPGGDLTLKLLDPDQETSVATWASVLLLATAAGAAAIAGRHAAAGRQRVRWLVLAALLLAMSVDEVATGHEHLGGLIEAQFGVSRFLWIVPGAMVAFAAMVLLLQLARGLPPSVGRRLIGGLALYLTGALVVEGISGLVGDDGSLLYGLVTAIEETMELAGIALLVSSISGYLRRCGVRVIVSDR